MNRTPPRTLFRKVIRLLTRTIIKWQQDRCVEMGAALAYYAIFSLFPLLLVGLSIVGFLLGPNTNAFNQILSFVERAFPPEVFDIIQSTLLNLNESSVGAGIIGFGLLVFTASGIFGALSSSMDVIWKATPAHLEHATWRTGVWAVIRRRIFGIILVFLTAVLMIVSLIFNVAIKIAFEVLQSFGEQLPQLPIQLTQSFFPDTLEFLTLFLILMLAVMVLFKTLPDTKIAWGDVWLGAIMTTFLLIGLQQLFGSSVVQIGSRFHSYGVIGGFMALMFWLYLTCQLFFLGSVFTYVYARLFGSRRDHPVHPHRYTSA